MNPTADTIRNADRQQLGELYEQVIGHNPTTEGADTETMRASLLDYLTELDAPARLVTYPSPENLERLRAEPAPVYHKYPDNYAPQPAHLYLDEDGEVSADWGDANSVTMDVAEGRTLRFRIPAQVTGKALVAMLEDDRILRLLERIHVGHSVEWDGSNHRGRLTDAAQEAADRLDAKLGVDRWGDSDVATVWTVEEWMQSSTSAQDLAGKRCMWREAQQFAVTKYSGDIFVVRAESTDEELRKVAVGIERSAEIENAILSDDAYDWLEGLRNTCLENADE